MITNIFNALFGCWHRNYSFPMTAKRGQRSAAASITGTYVVCLDCGKEFAYDWHQMKVISADAKEARGIAGAVESYAGK
jgi:hypothetical protein